MAALFPKWLVFVRSGYNIRIIEVWGSSPMEVWSSEADRLLTLCDMGDWGRFCMSQDICALTVLPMDRSGFKSFSL